MHLNFKKYSDYLIELGLILWRIAGYILELDLKIIWITLLTGFGLILCYVGLGLGKHLDYNTGLRCYFFPYKTQWFQICYLVHVNLQVGFSTAVIWSFPNKNKNWVIFSHFSHLRFKVMTLNLCYRDKHVK